MTLTEGRIRALLERLSTDIVGTGQTARSFDVEVDVALTAQWASGHRDICLVSYGGHTFVVPRDVGPEEFLIDVADRIQEDVMGDGGHPWPEAGGVVLTPGLSSDGWAVWTDGATVWTRVGELRSGPP